MDPPAHTEQRVQQTRPHPPPCVALVVAGRGQNRQESTKHLRPGPTARAPYRRRDSSAAPRCRHPLPLPLAAPAPYARSGWNSRPSTRPPVPPVPSRDPLRPLLIPSHPHPRDPRAPRPILPPSLFTHTLNPTLALTPTPSTPPTPPHSATPTPHYSATPTPPVNPHPRSGATCETLITGPPATASLESCPPDSDEGRLCLPHRALPGDDEGPRSYPFTEKYFNRRRTKTLKGGRPCDVSSLALRVRSRTRPSRVPLARAIDARFTGDAGLSTLILCRQRSRSILLEESLKYN